MLDKKTKKLIETAIRSSDQYGIAQIHNASLMQILKELKKPGPHVSILELSALCELLDSTPSGNKLQRLREFFEEKGIPVL